MPEEYHESMQITKAFRFCPNAFRVDLYRGCDFGCKYCFANMTCFDEEGRSKWGNARIDKLQKRFELALETDKESKDILVELLRHRVPIHCGGMSDPFQSREWEYELTYKFIELCNRYNYPVCFSTKTSYIPEKYFDILNPELHAFQISILGWSADYVKLWEGNTPSAQERLKFVRKLRDKGYWCSIRIQPIIDINNVLQLVQEAKDIPSYYSVEHLRMIYDNKPGMDAFYKYVTNKEDFINSPHHLEVRRDVKIKNIKQIQRAANSFNVKVGVGDNDLHYLSQSRNCCGIDTINKNFDSYLKYNLTYMTTGETNFEELYVPKMNPRKHINDAYAGSVVDCKKYTNEYIRKHWDYVGGPYKLSIEDYLFSHKQRKLF